MKAFLVIVFIFLAATAFCLAQTTQTAQTTVKLGENQVTVSRQKWLKGVRRNLRAPDLFNTNNNNNLDLTPSAGGYYYQADFTNDKGAKIIGIIWEYVFCDRVTHEELGRHKFISKITIKQGNTGTIEGFHFNPPSGTISADALGEKNKKDQYEEKVEIKAVLYKDGALWRSKNASDKDCKRLRYVARYGRTYR
jgi:hypothetical protein